MSNQSGPKRLCNCRACNGEIEQPQSTAYYHESFSSYRIGAISEPDPEMKNRAPAADHADEAQVPPGDSDHEEELEQQFASESDDEKTNNEAVEILACQVIQMVTDKLITKKGAMAMINVFNGYIKVYLSLHELVIFISVLLLLSLIGRM